MRITNAGRETKQTKRIKGNVKTKDNQLPILSGTSKDHKAIDDPIKGPDVRPIMGAMVGPNVGPSTFANIIIRTVADEADTGLVSKSTEETLAKVEKYNKERDEANADEEKVIVGSLDIDKWYPNTIAEPSAKVIRKMVEESKVDFDEID